MGGTIFLFSQCSVIKPGHHGVMNRSLGKGLKTDKVYKDGITWISPFNGMIKVSTQWKSYQEDIAILTKDELHTTLKLSIIIRPIENELPNLILDVGKDYYSAIVKPIFFSVSRGTIANYEYSQLSSQSSKIEEEILSGIKKNLQGKHIEFDKVTLDHIIYSSTVADATDNKLATRQVLEQKEYELEIAKKEAEIQIINATGQRDAQIIIENGLSRKYLQFKSLEVQEKLANSSNSTFYFVPLGDDGLPIIIDAGDK
jgi:regulator of protease activity HflC (stomatin/prohibitin superfamily)